MPSQTREEAQQLVQQMYVSMFGRPADPEGFNYWTDEELDRSQKALKEGQYISWAKEFVDTPEGNQTYDPSGDRSIDTLIIALYLNCFGREPDADGLEFWKTRYESGAVSAADLAQQISNAAQNEDAEVLNKKVKIADLITDLVAGRERDDPQYGQDPDEYGWKYTGELAAETMKKLLESVVSDPNIGGSSWSKEEMRDFLTQMMSASPGLSPNKPPVGGGDTGGGDTGGGDTGGGDTGGGDTGGGDTGGGDTGGGDTGGGDTGGGDTGGGDTGGGDTGGGDTGGGDTGGGDTGGGDTGGGDTGGGDTGGGDTGGGDTGGGDTGGGDTGGGDTGGGDTGGGDTGGGDTGGGDTGGGDTGGGDTGGGDTGGGDTGGGDTGGGDTGGGDENAKFSVDGGVLKFTDNAVVARLVEIGDPTGEFENNPGYREFVFEDMNSEPRETYRINLEAGTAIAIGEGQRVNLAGDSLTNPWGPGTGFVITGAGTLSLVSPDQTAEQINSLDLSGFDGKMSYVISDSLENLAHPDSAYLFENADYSGRVSLTDPSGPLGTVDAWEAFIVEKTLPQMSPPPGGEARHTYHLQDTAENLEALLVDNPLTAALKFYGAASVDVTTEASQELKDAITRIFVDDTSVNRPVGFTINYAGEDDSGEGGGEGGDDGSGGSDDSGGGNEDENAKLYVKDGALVFAETMPQARLVSIGELTGNFREFAFQEIEGGLPKETYYINLEAGTAISIRAGQEFILAQDLMTDTWGTGTSFEIKGAGTLRLAGTGQTMAQINTLDLSEFEGLMKYTIRDSLENLTAAGSKHIFENTNYTGSVVLMAPPGPLGTLGIWEAIVVERSLPQGTVPLGYVPPHTYLLQETAENLETYLVGNLAALVPKFIGAEGVEVTTAASQALIDALVHVFNDDAGFDRPYGFTITFKAGDDVEVIRLDNVRVDMDIDVSKLKGNPADTFDVDVRDMTYSKLTIRVDELGDGSKPELSSEVGEAKSDIYIKLAALPSIGGSSITIENLTLSSTWEYGTQAGAEAIDAPVVNDVIDISTWFSGAESLTLSAAVDALTDSITSLHIYEGEGDAEGYLSFDFAFGLDPVTGDWFAGFNLSLQNLVSINEFNDMLVAIDTVNDAGLESTLGLFQWLKDGEILVENGPLARDYVYSQQDLALDGDADAALIKGLLGILVHEGTLNTGVSPDWIDG